MCWSLEVSIITFVLGIFISIDVASFHRSPPIVRYICLAWQPVIFMQFFEAMIWRELRDQKGDITGSYGAIFTAMLQPSLMGLLLMSRDGIQSSRRFVATLLIIAHIYWYSYSLTQISPIVPLDINSEQCTHIDFAYWEKLPYPDFMYIFTTVNLFLLLIEPIDLAVFLISVSGFTYLLSYILYNCGESNGSLWCWASSVIPILVSLYWEKYHTAPEVSIFGRVRF